MIREPYRDGRDSTWSGPGFVRANEDSFIEFDVTDLTTTMEYDLVIRYEPQVSEKRWTLYMQIVNTFRCTCVATRLARCQRACPPTRRIRPRRTLFWSAVSNRADKSVLKFG